MLFAVGAGIVGVGGVSAAPVINGAVIGDAIRASQLIQQVQERFHGRDESRERSHGRDESRERFHRREESREREHRREESREREHRREESRERR
jgi:hypothetical protein